MYINGELNLLNFKKLENRIQD